MNMHFFNKKLCATLILVFFVCFCLLTGGFEIICQYQYDIIQTSAEGSFSPRIYVSSTDERTIILPGILNIITASQPQDIYISKKDECFERKHEDFNTVQIDQFDVIYDDGKIEHIISKQSRSSIGHFSVPKGNISESVIIHKCVYKNAGFTIKMTGKAIRKDLSTSSFKRENVYKGKTMVKMYSVLWYKSQGG